MLRRVRLFLEMIRFSHTVFALPFALTGAVLAWTCKHAGEDPPSFHGLQLLGIVLCMVFARSAAMAFNRLVDRKIDAENPRTRMRHLPAGLLSPLAVGVFAVVCSLAFVGSTLIFQVVFNNPWPLYLGVPVLVFICAYSYTKRFTALAHFWLGTSLFLAPLAAWIAIRGLDMSTLNDLLIPALLGLVVLFWVSGFDILYACQDVEFDRSARLHSVPAFVGVPWALRLAAGCHLIMWLALVGLYFAATPPLGYIFLGGVLATAGLLLYEHWLVRPNDLSRVNQAFFHVNGVISIGLFVVVLVQILIR